MSLFAETLRKVDQLEVELKAERAANKELREKLAKMNGDNFKAANWRPADDKKKINPWTIAADRLSESEVEQQFAERDELDLSDLKYLVRDEAEMAEQADATDLKPVPSYWVSVRSRLSAPIAALLRRE